MASENSNNTDARGSAFNNIGRDQVYQHNHIYNFGHSSNDSIASGNSSPSSHHSIASASYHSLVQHHYHFHHSPNSGDSPVSSPFSSDGLEHVPSSHRRVRSDGSATSIASGRSSQSSHRNSASLASSSQLGCPPSSGESDTDSAGNGRVSDWTSQRRAVVSQMEHTERLQVAQARRDDLRDAYVGLKEELPSNDWKARMDRASILKRGEHEP